MPHFTLAYLCNCDEHQYSILIYAVLTDFLNRHGPASYARYERYLHKVGIQHGERRVWPLVVGGRSGVHVVFLVHPLMPTAIPYYPGRHKSRRCEWVISRC